MSLLPDLRSSDKSMSYATFLGFSTAQLAFEHLVQHRPGFELLGVGMYMAIMLGIIERTNTLEQHVVSEDTFGWIWSRNKHPWLKAMTTISLIALPQLLLQWSPKLIEQGINRAESYAEITTLSLAIGMVLFEYVKDGLALAYTKYAKTQDNEQECETWEFFNQMNAHNASSRVNDLIGKDRLPKTNPDPTKEEESRKRLAYYQAIQSGNVGTAVQLGRELNLSMRFLRHSFAREFHPDRNLGLSLEEREAKGDKLKGINARLDELT